MMRLLERWVRKKLHNYVEIVNTVDATLPKQLQSKKSAAVIGGGLAGIGASALLAERGFHVTLFEQNPYLGGKCGAWEVSFADGTRARLDHGFHAFFRHYYNLLAFLEKTGSSKYLKRIDDYAILTRTKARYSFKTVATTPILNILSMMKSGFFGVKDVILNPGSRHMVEFLKYDESRCFEAFDGISFEEFAARSRLPAPLRLVFSTFARAFFASPDRLSTAQLMKSFHFFYLSNDCGLLYDYFTTDYTTALLDPVEAYLARFGARLKLDRPVGALGFEREKFIVDSERFDYVVLATNVVAAKKICANSGWIKDISQETYEKLTALEPSNGYAVYRIWLDRRVEGDWPVFIITEKHRILDSVTFFHQFEPAATRWAEENNGGVYELHCYALPTDLSNESEVKKNLLSELYDYFPELKGGRIVREHLQVKRDFTSLHTGLHLIRPHYRSGIPGLYLAGDWVRIPTPAMLMEGAFTSGLFCANGILSENGLQEEPIRSVPAQGIFS